MYKKEYRRDSHHPNGDIWLREGILYRGNLYIHIFFPKCVTE